MKHLSALLRSCLSAALLMLLMLAGPAARAQAPAWQMAMGITSGLSRVAATATDANGNVYIVGRFRGSATFGNTSMSTGNGFTFDVFVAKWNSSTNGFAWAQQIGTATDDEEASAVAVNGTSVYVTGYFAGTTLAVGTTTLTTTNPQSGNRSNGFVVKLTDAGTTATFSWAKGIGGTVGNEAVAAVVATGTSVYITGYFISPTLTLGSITLTNAGAFTADIFIGKLTDAGNTAAFTWAQRAGGDSYDYPAALALSGSDLYVAGKFTSFTANFGTSTVANAGYGDDLFVAKLADTGTSSSFIWAQAAGSRFYDDRAYGLAVSGSNVYVAGSFASRTIAFGSTTLTNVASGGDAFVAKLTDAGTTSSFTWAQQVGGSNEEAALGIVAHGTNVYISGYFRSGTASFGSISLPNSTNPFSGYDDIFLAHLADAGASSSFTWAKQAGNSGSNDQATAIALSGTKVYVAGYVDAPANFGSLVIPSQTGTQTGFLASLTDPTLTATAAAPGTLSFSLAPNPARAAATLTLPALPGTATATLTLRDAMGRALRTETVALPATGLRHELDLHGLAPGLYAVQVLAGPAAATQRLVVE
ncbi:hypothetical protein ACVWYF_001203 [Hymenobacter sp. UYAg731]